MSEFAQALIWFVTPFSETAAWNRSARADQPVDHEPAVAQAEDAEPLGIREAEPDDVVERGVDVVGVDAAPVAELRPDPVAAVAGAEPRMFGRTTR